ncbi:ureidoglycolate hydrolase, partial [Lineolata rhizophorae]
LHIPLEPLTRASFAPFGTVIENPARSSSSTSNRNPPPHLTPRAVPANQGTATKYLDVAHMQNHYEGARDARGGGVGGGGGGGAPSGRPARLSINMFACAPRALRGGSVLDVRLLERHPFTAQAFVPVGLAPGAGPTPAKYLVVVAPTVGEGGEGERREPKGRGAPDLSRVRAFLAHGRQGVTYAAGTWHAPMAVVGRETVDFVVVQWANGVSEEDCELLEL